MIDYKLGKGLTLFPRTSVGFDLKSLGSNPIVTVVLYRKEIRKDYELVFRLEKELSGNLPEELSRILKINKGRGILVYTKKKKERMKREVITKLQKDFVLEFSLNGDDLFVVARANLYKDKTAHIHKSQAKNFFKIKS